LTPATEPRWVGSTRTSTRAALFACRWAARGFGVFGRGGGQFSGVTGMMSLNAVVSVFPRTLTNFYLLRINDPEGRFRSTVANAWT